MDSVIDELYDETLSPVRLLRQSEAYQQLSALHADAIDRFRKTLDADQQRLFASLLQESLDVTSSETKAYFHAGFCMGARLMREIMESGS